MIKRTLLISMFVMPLFIAGASESNKTHTLHLEFKGGLEEYQKLYLKTVNDYVSLVKEQKSIPMIKDVMLSRAIEGLYEAQVKGKNAAGRQEVVKKMIGEENYNFLEGYFQKQLKTGSREEKQSAMLMLGGALFSVASVDLVEPYIVSDQKTLEFRSILCLVYLDVDGCSNTLKKYILSGVLSDGYLLEALNALRTIGDKDLEKTALFVAMHEKTGACVVRESLELLREANGYVDIIETNFLSNRFPFSSSLKLSKKEDENNSLNRYMVKELYKNGEEIKNKKEVFAKARLLVETLHRDLYMYAVFLLAKFGSNEDRQFLETIINQPDTPQDKAKFLKNVLEKDIE